MPEVCIYLLILHQHLAFLVSNLDHLVASLSHLLLGFVFVLSQHLLSVVRVLVDLDLALDTHPPPPCEQVVIIMRIFPDLKGLDDEEFILIVSEMRLREGDTVEVFILLDYFSFILLLKIMVNWHKINSLGSKSYLCNFWLLLFDGLLL